MIDLLNDYIGRSLPEWGDFTTNPNLRKKVDDEGRFLPFCGNTAVFLLDDKTRQALLHVQQELYDAAGWMLAQKLDHSTFHMTLHDLVNGPEGDWGLSQRMEDAQGKAEAILRRWRDGPVLRMRATWTFNMVNTSIVLGLAPADGESWNRLDEMYCALESVVPLGYALTPHITLAYYRPGVYSQEQLGCLGGALRPVELDVTLSMEDLVLQSFRDMNRYETIL